MFVFIVVFAKVVIAVAIDVIHGIPFVAIWLVHFVFVLAFDSSFEFVQGRANRRIKFL